MVMAQDKDRNSHEFIVSGVELVEDDSDDRFVIVLDDVHGGKVRLHLNNEMAELLSSKVSLTVTKKLDPSRA
jgi:hypothetical protein